VECEQVDADKARRFIQQIQVIHQAVQEQLESSQAKYKIDPGGSSQNSIELKYSNGKVKLTKWKSSSTAFR
jgi:hypothetical protein